MSYVFCAVFVFSLKQIKHMLNVSDINVICAMHTTICIACCTCLHLHVKSWPPSAEAV